MTSGVARARSLVQWIGFFGAPAAAVVICLVLPESYPAGDGSMIDFPYAGRITAGIAVWMAIWWMTEAIPISATALLPLAILPITGAVPIRQAAAPYAHELIFLFMGGFILALSMQRWGLHRRIALSSLRLGGARARGLVGAFMATTGALSMWVSNTATAIMMLPIVVSVIELLGGVRARGGAARSGEETNNIAICLLLGVAYAASIGGIGTLIGTPPNLFLASYVEDELGVQISFVRWMGVGVPLVAVFLPVAWLLLTRTVFPIRDERLTGAGELIDEARRELGPMNRGERATLVVFGATAALWITRPLLSDLSWRGVAPLAGLTDPGIAILAALALFLIPVDVQRRIFVMDWRTASQLPWGILILFGGGLSLASAIRINGVGEWIGHQVGSLAGLPPVLLVVLVVTLVIFLTELTSNTASTATLVPILAALAPGLGVNPLLLVVPAAIAASCAFMLPVATPPNAIVFSSGHLRIPQMCRAGLWLNLIGIVLITAAAYALAIPLLGG